LEDLDYDIHLKPATDIKKSKGEDFAIDYLFELLGSRDWRYYDRWSILDKMAGYYKKGNHQNKDRILKEFDNLLNQSESIDYYAKVACYKRVAALYEYEKEYDKAFQMLSGAMANNNPNSTNYLFELSEISSRNAQVIGKEGLSNEQNCINYLYWYFSHLFYLAAWYNVKPWYDANRHDERTANWQLGIDPLFPFETKFALNAVNSINKNESIRSCANKFQELLFKELVEGIQNKTDQDEKAEIANQFVKNYLKYLLGKEDMKA
jgi:hypothetical protein